MISELLKKGHENAIPRADLKEAVGIRDNRMREQIARESKAGNFICNLGDGAGYFLLDLPTKEEFAKGILKEYTLAKGYLNKERGRAFETLERLRPLEGYLEGLQDGNRWKSERKLANLTRAEVIKKTGIDSPTLSKIENGRIEPTEEQRKTLSSLYGIK